MRIHAGTSTLRAALILTAAAFVLSGCHILHPPVPHIVIGHGHDHGHGWGHGHGHKVHHYRPQTADPVNEFRP